MPASHLIELLTKGNNLPFKFPHLALKASHQRPPPTWQPDILVPTSGETSPSACRLLSGNRPKTKSAIPGLQSFALHKGTPQENLSRFDQNPLQIRLSGAQTYVWSLFFPCKTTQTRVPSTKATPISLEAKRGFAQNTPIPIQRSKLATFRGTILNIKRPGKHTFPNPRSGRRCADRAASRPCSRPTEPIGRGAYLFLRREVVIAAWRFGNANKGQLKNGLFGK